MRGRRMRSSPGRPPVDALSDDQLEWPPGPEMGVQIDLASVVRSHAYGCRAATAAGACAETRNRRRPHGVMCDPGGLCADVMAEILTTPSKEDGQADGTSCRERPRTTTSLECGLSANASQLHARYERAALSNGRLLLARVLLPRRLPSYAEGLADLRPAVPLRSREPHKLAELSL